MFKVTINNNDNSLLNEVIIKNENLKFEAIIYPNLGASLQKLTKLGIELIDGISNNEEGLTTYKNKFNSSFLFPFPNRISNGKYNFNNIEYQLNCNETGLNNALHGYIYNQYFVITKQEENETSASVTFSYNDKGTTQGFPFPYIIDITYTFTSSKLTLDFKVTNTGLNEFPFGLGWHPYFKVSNLDSSVLDFDGNDQYFLDDKMIPHQEIPLKFNTPLTINDTFLDDCFIINKPATTFNCEAFNIAMDFSSKTEKSYLQVYTPDTRDCIAIEPMTSAADAFNSGDGLIILPSGETFTGEYGIYLK